MANIDERAYVHPDAEIGDGTIIGPFCLIGADAKIGKNNKLHSHVNVHGHTTIGDGNEFFPFNNIGDLPQDKTYKGERTRTVIGDNNIFREHVTIHRATLKEDKITEIGNNGYFMNNVHIAHDCRIGNNVLMASGSMAAGHVRIGDNVQMSGQCGVSQFVTIGHHSFIGGATAVDRDVPPYCTAYGNRVRLKGVNIIGLKRNGYQREEISTVIEYYRMMESSTLSPRSFAEENKSNPDFQGNRIIDVFVDFIENSKIGLPPFMS